MVLALVEVVWEERARGDASGRRAVGVHGARGQGGAEVVWWWMDMVLVVGWWFGAWFGGRW